MILKLAIRNIFSHLNRSLIIVGVVAFVCMMVFVFLAFAEGEIQNIERSVLQFRSPKAEAGIVKDYLKLKSEGIITDLGFEDSILQYRDISAFLDTKGFDYFYDRDGLWTELICEENSVDFMYFKPYDPGKDRFVDSLKIMDGRFIGEGSRELVLHYLTVDALGLELGDTCRIKGQDFFGQMIQYDVVLVGTYKGIPDNPNLNYSAFIDVAGFENISGLYEGEAFSIMIRDPVNIDDLQTELDSRFPDRALAVIKWSDMNRGSGYTTVYEMVKVLIQVVSLVIMTIIAFGVMSVVSSNLKSRKREIATYYCIGTERWYLTVVYTIELLLVNLFASFIGVGLGLGVLFAVNTIGFTTTDPGLMMVFGGDQLYLGYSVNSLLFVIVGIGMITLITSLISLLKALSVSPLEALREEK